MRYKERIRIVKIGPATQTTCYFRGYRDGPVRRRSNRLGRPPTDGTTTVNTVNFTRGETKYATSAPAIGTHNITATYEGSTSFTGSAATLSKTANQSTTSTSLTSSLNRSNAGQSVTFKATIAARFGGVVTGSVVFADGSTILKMVSINANEVQYTTSGLAVGMHTITATYSGSTDFSGSSGMLTQTVS